MTQTDHLVALGVSAANNTASYRYNNPGPDLLETFEAPRGADNNGSIDTLTIHIEVPEFTSLCPLTKQPDFATIIIDYTPDKLCVESKSLKLYMMAFREHGEFHEACVQRILRDFVDVLDPIYLSVKGEFAPRGGIPFWPTATYYRPHAEGRNTDDTDAQ